MPSSSMALTQTQIASRRKRIFDESPFGPYHSTDRFLAELIEPQVKGTLYLSSRLSGMTMQV